MYRQRIPFISVAIMVVAGLLAFFAPLPYAVIKPGPTQNVLASAIKISGVKSFSPSGKLLTTTVLVSNPGARIMGAEVIINWVEGDSVILPRIALYPKEVSTKEELQVGKKEMLSSQADATTAALAWIARTHTAAQLHALGLDRLTGGDIAIKLKETGGPSAGLVFALGIVAKVEPEDWIRGRTIAGTGTIDGAGNVGPIGGIDQKLIGARRAGATLFLVPTDNCADITRVPKGMTIVPVGSLVQAIAVLRAPGTSYASCPR